MSQRQTVGCRNEDNGGLLNGRESSGLVPGRPLVRAGRVSPLLCGRAVALQEGAAPQEIQAGSDSLIERM